MAPSKAAHLRDVCSSFESCWVTCPLGLLQQTSSWGPAWMAARFLLSCLLFATRISQQLENPLSTKLDNILKPGIYFHVSNLLLFSCDMNVFWMPRKGWAGLEDLTVKENVYSDLMKHTAYSGQTSKSDNICINVKEVNRNLKVRQQWRATPRHHGLRIKR